MKLENFIKIKDLIHLLQMHIWKLDMGKKKGGYISFAYICAQRGKNLDYKYIDNESQVKNYNLIKNCIDTCNYECYDLSFLKEIKDISILDIDLEKKEQLNQKWHLYVSLFAQSIVEGTGFKWDSNFKKYSCMQLKLWMAEEAGLDLEQIKMSIDNGCSSKEINLLIKEILWDDIYKKIKQNK